MTEHDTTNEALEAESYPPTLYIEWETFYDEENDIEHHHLVADQHSQCLAEMNERKLLAVYQFVKMIEVDNVTTERDV